MLGTAVGHLCPVNFILPAPFQQDSCLVFSRSCPGFVIALSDFKGCLTGQAFLLIETLRKAPWEGGKREE